jgi:hypothetical protein
VAIQNLNIVFQLLAYILMFMGMVCCLWVFDCCLEEILFQSFEGNKGNNKITEQSYKGKVKTHNYINRQNQSTTGKL